MSGLRPRLDPEARFGLRFSLLAGAVLLVAVPFGLLLEQVTRDGPLTRVDTSAANHLHQWLRGSPALVSALEVVTTLGSFWWLSLVVIAASVALLRVGRRRAVVFLVAASITDELLIRVVKALVGRPRPSLLAPVATATGKRFPSGHTMGATVVYGAVVLLFAARRSPRVRRLAVVAWLVLVGSIAFTRLALGVHYITDVLAGFVLGCAWLALATAAFRVWQQEETAEEA
jgi:undecaprenyl-diphosphatase